MVKVLSTSKNPLELSEILERISARNLVDSQGPTPHKTLYSIIVRLEARRKENGDPLVFKKHKKGGVITYSLNK